MEQGGKRFIYQVVFITALFILSGYILFYTLLAKYRFGTFIIIPLFFGTLSIVVHLFLIRRARTNLNRFIPGFLGATGVKLAVYLLFLIPMLLLNRPHIVSILICFLIMYVIYSIHEVIAVLAYLRNQ